MLRVYFQIIYLVHLKKKCLNEKSNSVKKSLGICQTGAILEQRKCSKNRITEVKTKMNTMIFGCFEEYF